MKNVLLALLLCCASNQIAAQAGKPAAKSPAAAAEPQAGKIDPVKEASIRKLFEIQGTKNVIDRTVAVMLENTRPQIAAMLPPGDYKEKLLDAFLERFKKKLDANQMVNASLPVYDKYFSKEDIDGLIAFYATPLGKKTISVLPQVLTESQAAGMKLGERWGQQAMTEVLDENPELRKALEAAAGGKR